jgi:hypothetical protein
LQWESAGRPEPIRVEEEKMNTYFASSGPECGPFLYRDAGNSPVGIVETPEGARPIGKALATSWAPDGAALWKLTVRGATLPGRFVLRDRRFTPAL